MAVLLIAIAPETVGHNPQPLTKALIIVTLALAWLFSNTVYALHYAHLVYIQPDAAASGSSSRARRSRSIGTSSISPSPAAWRSRRRTWRSPNQHIRKVVTIHCLAAFAFNIGVLAFTINVLGQRLGGDVDLRRRGGLAARGDQAAADDQHRAGERVERHPLAERRASRAPPPTGSALYSVTAR